MRAAPVPAAGGYRGLRRRCESRSEPGARQRRGRGVPAVGILPVEDPQGLQCEVRVPCLVRSGSQRGTGGRTVPRADVGKGLQESIRASAFSRQLLQGGGHGLGIIHLVGKEKCGDKGRVRCPLRVRGKVCAPRLLDPAGKVEQPRDFLELVGGTRHTLRRDQELLSGFQEGAEVRLCPKVGSKHGRRAGGPGVGLQPGAEESRRGLEVSRLFALTRVLEEGVRAKHRAGY